MRTELPERFVIVITPGNIEFMKSWEVNKGIESMFFRVGAWFEYVNSIKDSCIVNVSACTDQDSIHTQIKQCHGVVLTTQEVINLIRLPEIQNKFSNPMPCLYAITEGLNNRIVDKDNNIFYFKVKWPTDIKFKQHSVSFDLVDKNEIIQPEYTTWVARCEPGQTHHLLELANYLQSIGYTLTNKLKAKHHRLTFMFQKPLQLRMVGCMKYEHIDNDGTEKTPEEPRNGPTICFHLPMMMQDAKDFLTKQYKEWEEFYKSPVESVEYNHPSMGKGTILAIEMPIEFNRPPTYTDSKYIDYLEVLYKKQSAANHFVGKTDPKALIPPPRPTKWYYWYHANSYGLYVQYLLRPLGANKLYEVCTAEGKTWKGLIFKDDAINQKCIKEMQPAMPIQVELILSVVAIKKGYKKGVKFKSLHCSGEPSGYEYEIAHHKIKYGEKGCDSLSAGHGYFYAAGKWADIVNPKEKSIEKEVVNNSGPETELIIGKEAKDAHKRINAILYIKKCCEDNQLKTDPRWDIEIVSLIEKYGFPK